MKKRLVLAAIVIVAWLVFFAWQRSQIDRLTVESPAARGTAG